MKKYLLLLCLMLVLCLISCEDVDTKTNPETDVVTNIPTNKVTTPETEVLEGDYMVSQVKTLANGKTYLEVDGYPYAIRGGQIRIDGLLNRPDNVDSDAPKALTYEEIEAYFKLASDCGLNTVEISIDWKRIEPGKDIYDFTLIDKLLTMTNKYGLKCEFLWFSTNMCGDSHGFHLPDYILDDRETYPVFENSDKEYFNNMYGEMFWLQINHPNLMERESLVIEKMMDYVYEWNLANGKKNPLIGIQVHNEADGLLRWRLDQKDLALEGKKLSPEYLWNATLEALDNAGKSFKKGQYKVYTRCNMTVTCGVDEFPQFIGQGFSPIDVYNLEGIDIVGDDPYQEDPHTINQTINAYAFANNYPHIAENMGNYASSAALFLTTYQAGGSYMFYDLATPEYFVWLNGGSSYQMDQGLVNPDFSYKAHSEETISIVNGIKAMGSILPLINREDFAVFNVLKREPVENYEQTINTSKLSLKYKTTNGGIAFAITYGEYLYLYANEDCSFEVLNANFTYKADIGYFDLDQYQVVESKVINPTIQVVKNQLYRIKIRNVNQVVTSTTNENV